MREDGQSREVLRVARDTDPLQIALLVDNSTSMRNRLSVLRKSVAAFVDATREDVHDRSDHAGRATHNCRWLHDRPRCSAKSHRQPLRLRGGQLPARRHRRDCARARQANDVAFDAGCVDGPGAGDELSPVHRSAALFSRERRVASCPASSAWGSAGRDARSS